MATPLTAFSKYAGVLMAVMCVLLMFAFVVGDPLMQYAGGSNGGGSSRDNNVVATWRGGRINERQLEQAVVHRNILAAFQQSIYEVGTLDAREDGVEDLGLRVRPIDLPRSREQGVEASVVRSKIFAQRAADAGMVVSDSMIVDYLRALGRDRVSNDQMRELLSRMNVGGGRKATIDFIFELLREAMLANNYLSSHTYVFQTILPEERWEDWKKVNERVVVEAAPLPIEEFLDEAPEPTDAELASFFAEYRSRVPSTDTLTGYGNVELPSPLPAFATPPRVRLAYLKADFNVAVDRVMDEITDEQIAEYYEANKESFVEADRGLFGDDSLFGDDDLLSDEPADEPTGEPEASEEPSEEAAEEAETPADETESPAEEAPSEDAAEEPATEEATEEAPADGPAMEEPEDSSNPLRNQDAPVEEEEEEEEEPAADDTQYQPLEEVSDEIRRRLAFELADTRLREQMARLKSQLDDAFVGYFDDLLEAEAAGDGAEEPTPPEKLANLQPLAEEEQLELVELDQAPQFELRDSEIGASRNTDPSDPNALPVWYFAFRSDDVDPYQPMVTRSANGDRYLVLVTKRYEGVTPKVEDVRDQVIAAWKRTKAAEIALAKAEELAKSASETGLSLADYFTDNPNPLVATDKIQETDAFSLFTFGPVAPSAREVPLQLSQPEPLVAPGPELLMGVFDLDPGKVGAELNHDHSIAYLLRIAEKIGNDEELRREFLRDGDRWMGAASLMQARAQNKLFALVGNLLDESGLEWERPADQLQ